MTFARAATLPRGLSRTVLRRAGSSTRNRSWRQVGRRGYASDHGHGQQQGSEIPWIVGSAAVFFPSAAWLLSQTPKASSHEHHEESHGEKDDEEEKEDQPEEESKEEEEEPKEESEESKDEGKDDSKDESEDESKDDEDSKAEGGDAKAEGSKSDDSEPGKDADGKSKGPGEGQKGERKPSEKKGEKDSQGEHSGAQNPYLDDDEKSKKGSGMKETAKIHGTVDSRQGARGVGQTGDRAD